jgi:hypothetical protein
LHTLFVFSRGERVAKKRTQRLPLDQQQHSKGKAGLTVGLWETIKTIATINALREITAENATLDDERRKMGTSARTKTNSHP